ncbi:MAG TPA: MFS transporter [Acidimicrobiales bacterium]|nr:MFS transporter [Acidimicrobiales bacterium]
MSDRRLVGSLAVTTTLGYGVLFYSYGVLLLPMERDLGWRRTFLSGSFSLALLVAAVLTVPVGRWLDTHGPRALLTAGAALAGVLVTTWAFVDNLATFVLLWVGLGACMSLLFYEPAFTILTKRLDGASRHRAITTVTMLAGLASTIFGPLTAALEHALGWRRAVFALAVILTAIAVPLLATALRPGHETRQPAHDDTVPREVLLSAPFWCLTTAYLLSAVTTFAIAVHLVPYLVEEGWRSGHAAMAVGGVGLLQVVGRSAFSRLAERHDAGRLGSWVLASKAVGLAALVVSPTLAGVGVFLVVYGAANGLQTLTRATVVADLYGVRHYGALSGVIGSVSAVGGSVAPLALAAAVEAIGRYEPALWGLVAISLAAAGANHAALRRAAYERGAPLPR